MTLTIGQSVWLFDGNRRVYSKGQSGPVFREYFRECKVVGENRVSWILDSGFKIDKKSGFLRAPDQGGFYGYSPKVYPTLTDVDDAVWLNENAYRVSELVRNCKNAPLLRTIERMVTAPENQK